MEKKYHVYMSSTLDDLKNERREAAKMILELGHTPVSMEQFDIEDPGQAAFIRKTIEGCDYMLVIVAQKYNLSKDTSLVEQEYAHARRHRIPVLAMILADKVKKPSSRTESSGEAKKRLAELREKLKLHPYATWTNAGDLISRARELFLREMNVNPQAGWVRMKETISPLVANELGRLSSENAQLRYQARAEDREYMGRLRVKMKDTLKLLAGNKETMTFFYADGENWENARVFRYLKLFKLLAPELYAVKSVPELSRFLGSVLNPDLSKKPRKDFPTPSNTVKKIITVLRAFRVAKNLEERGGDEVWELTEFGKELYSYYMIYQFRKTASGEKNRSSGAEDEAAGGQK